MNDIAATTPIPNWMVRLATWALGVLGSGAVATLILIGTWVWHLSERQAEIEARQSAADVKQVDILNAVNSIQRDNRADFLAVNQSIHALERKVDVITSRMP